MLFIFNDNGIEHALKPLKPLKPLKQNIDEHSSDLNLTGA